MAELFKFPTPQEVKKANPYDPKATPLTETHKQIYSDMASGKLSNSEGAKQLEQSRKEAIAKGVVENNKPDFENRLAGVKGKIKELRTTLDPMKKEDSISFNKSLMYETPYTKNPKLVELEKQHNDLMNERNTILGERADYLRDKLGRKDYSQFTGDNFWSKDGVFAGEGLEKNDRVYAIFDKYYRGGESLDFNKLLADDIRKNRKLYNNEIKVGNDLYVLSENGNSYDHYKLDEKGQPQHISVGTIYGLGSSLEQALKEKNLD